MLFRPLILLPALLLSALLPAGAQTPREDKLRLEMEQRANDLTNLQKTITVSDERRSELEADVKDLEKTRASLNSALIEAAQRARDLQDSISNSEVRLDKLLQTEEVIRLSLIKRRAVLGEILAVLQRMGRAPPPALLVQPKDVLSAIRSAMLVGAVLPDVRDKAEALAKDLDELVTVRSNVEEEADTLREDYQNLSEEQTRLALLLKEKRTESDITLSQLKAQQKRAQTLAEKATSLQDLIGTMESQIGSVRKAREDAVAAAETARRNAAERAAKRTAARTQEAKLQALKNAMKNPGRIAPAIPFDEARGLLPLPVRGAMISSFGEKGTDGEVTKGLQLTARPGSTVVSPADGWIVYAGPFRSYGQLLILNAGDEYHMVMAGMESVNVELGQFVLSGEPIATMGTRQLASLAQSLSSSVTLKDAQSLTDSNVTDAPPVLYVELRKDKVSIDPTPWWVVEASKDSDLDG